MMNSDGTFKEDIQCIVAQKNGCGAIFVSNLEAACNPLTLKKHNIGAVITAIKGKNLSDKIPKHIEYFYVPVVDHESCNIYVFFKDSFEFIEEERKRTNVLVHCMAGVSRSVTLVIAYIMQKSGAPFQIAYEYIHPNEAFVKQLLQHQKRLQSVTDSVNVQKAESQTGKDCKFPISKQPNSSVKKDNMTNLTDTCESWAKASSVHSVHLGKTQPAWSMAAKIPNVNGQKENECRGKNDYDKNLRENIKKLFNQSHSRVVLTNKNELVR